MGIARLDAMRCFTESCRTAIDPIVEFCRNCYGAPDSVHQACTAFCIDIATGQDAAIFEFGAHGADASHAGSDVGVGAGACLGDLGVAHVDGGEHGFDVVRPQVLHPDLAEGRDEVLGDVVAVAAGGLVGQPAAAGEPG